ncbi:MAG: ribosome maturation factor RimP, partial [Bradymonadaceae bacterium]
LSSEIKAEIESWAMEAAEVEGLVLYDVDIVPRGAWLIRVFVDRPEAVEAEGDETEESEEEPKVGVSVHDCVKVSRYMEAYLDADERVPESYNLEVSSPGVERPLKKDRHVEFAVGKLVQATVREPMDGRNKFVGKLLSFKDGVLDIHDRELDKVVAVNWDDVAKAKLKYDFEE